MYLVDQGIGNDIEREEEEEEKEEEKEEEEEEEEKEEEVYPGNHVLGISKSNYSLLPKTNYYCLHLCYTLI